MSGESSRGSGREHESRTLVKISAILDRAAIYERVRQEIPFKDAYEQRDPSSDGYVSLEDDRSALMGDEINIALGELLEEEDPEIEVTPANMAELVRNFMRSMISDDTEKRVILEETAAAIIEALAKKLKEQ